MQQPLLNIMFFFCLEVLKYVVYLCTMYDDVVFSVCIVTRGAVGYCVWKV